MSLISAAGQQPQTPAPPFRGTGTAVAVFATVTDAGGRAVRGLKKGDFEVLDEGKRREITTFAAADRPLTTTLLLDMNGPAFDLPWLRAAAMAFVDGLRPADRLRLGAFGNEVFLSPRMTNDVVYLRQVIDDELWPASASPLWNALHAALAPLPENTDRHSIVVLANGIDDPMPNQMKGRNSRNVIALAESSGTVVHVITFEDVTLDGGLRRIAERTGGRFERVADLSYVPDLMREIVDELHAEYLLGFAPAALDGRTHDLEVRTSRPELRVRARARYVATLPK